MTIDSSAWKALESFYSAQVYKQDVKDAYAEEPGKMPSYGLKSLIGYLRHHRNKNYFFVKDPRPKAAVILT